MQRGRLALRLGRHSCVGETQVFACSVKLRHRNSAGTARAAIEISVNNAGNELQPRREARYLHQTRRQIRPCPQHLGDADILHPIEARHHDRDRQIFSAPSSSSARSAYRCDPTPRSSQKPVFASSGAFSAGKATFPGTPPEARWQLEAVAPPCEKPRNQRKQRSSPRW